MHEWALGCTNAAPSQAAPRDPKISNRNYPATVPFGSSSDLK